MLLDLLKARDATRVGVSLADDFVMHRAGPVPNGRQGGGGPPAAQLQKLLQKFLQRVDHETRPLQLNLFKRAKLANSFKWRLLEKGVEPPIVDELTKALVLRLTAARVDPLHASNAEATRTPGRPKRPHPRQLGELLAAANDLLAHGEYPKAIDRFEELLAADPRHAVGHNSLGTVLCKVGRYREAEEHFRLAIDAKDGYAEAHRNLGFLLCARGLAAEAELVSRRALKLEPADVDARINLGTALLLLGRTEEARGCFEKALRAAPRNVGALIRMGELAALEGRFGDAEAGFKRALELDPKAPGAWGALVRLRAMTPADHAWLEGAEKAATAELAPLEEANLRFAIGKYHDDLGDFRSAFRNYQRANQLQKTAAPPYEHQAHKAFVDDLIRVYTPEALAQKHEVSSSSEKPVLVMGMPRSGTTLVAQILDAHPAAFAAGELAFWAGAVRADEAALRRKVPPESLREKLAASYLATLTAKSSNASRVVDKATANSDLLGIIHTIFPRARMIYVQRDAVDTCLSCYFQQLPPALNFTMDLADLANYYREHRRLIAHWRNVLPLGSLLTVRYEDLLVDQEKWTRRMLEFIGLPWDARCLDYNLTESTVITASYWQVRQAFYRSSVGRWRNYRKFIGPLLSLRDVGA